MADEDLEAPAVQNRSQRRAGRTRKRLLAAALALFTERGVDMATIEEITERADVGKGTFYRHFGNKDEVMGALTEEAFARLVDAIRRQAEGAQGLEDVLDRIVDAHLRVFLASMDEFVLLFQGRLLLKLQRNAADYLEEPFQKYLEEIELRIVPHAGRVDRPRVQRLVYAMAGFVQGFFSFAMLGMAPEELRATMEPLRRAFVAGSSAFLGAIKPGSPQELSTTGSAS